MGDSQAVNVFKTSRLLVLAIKENILTCIIFRTIGGIPIWLVSVIAIMVIGECVHIIISLIIIMRDPKGITWNTLFRKNNTKNIIMFFDQKVEDILFTKVI